MMALQAGVAAEWGHSREVGCTRMVWQSAGLRLGCWFSVVEPAGGALLVKSKQPQDRASQRSSARLAKMVWCVVCGVRCVATGAVGKKKKDNKVD